MQIGDKWAHVEIIDEEVIEEFEPWEGGGGGVTYKAHYWVLQCGCGKTTKVKQEDFRKKANKDCGCGIALRDGRKVIAGPYTVPQSTVEAILEYAQLHTGGNASHALTLLVREALKGEVESIGKLEVPDTEVDSAKR